MSVETSPVITTPVYMTPRIYRQISYGISQLFTIIHNIIFLGYNDTSLYDTTYISSDILRYQLTLHYYP